VLIRPIKAIKRQSKNIIRPGPEFFSGAVNQESEWGPLCPKGKEGGKK